MSGLGRVSSWPCSIRSRCRAYRCRTSCVRAKTALDGEAPKLRTWVKEVNAAMERVQMDPDFASRSLNEGFSGGEKKRHEIVQLELLNPRFAILDETDSGLDIDALRVVAAGVNRFSAQGDRGVLLITHYTRILRYIKPDYVHVFIAGRVAEQGGHELAERLEAEATTAMYARLRRLGRSSHHVARWWAGVPGHHRSLRCAQRSLALAEEPIAFDVEAIRADFPILERTRGWGRR